MSYVSEALEISADYRAVVAGCAGATPECANQWWFKHGKPVVSEMSGWGAPRDTPFASSAAYDELYDYAYSLLPDCSHKGFC